jgi:hypothetical protein
VKKLLLLGAVAALPLASVPVLAQLNAPLIPREKLFGNPSQTAGPAFAPDGKWISWIAPRDGVLNIWVAPASSPKTARALTNERSARSVNISGSRQQEHPVHQRQGRRRELPALRSRHRSAQQRSLTPFEKTRVQIVDISSEVKDRILVGVNNRDPQMARRPQPRSQDRQADARSDEHRRLCQLPRRRAAANPSASKSRADGGSDFYRVVNNAVEPKPFEQVALEDFQTPPRSGSRPTERPCTGPTPAAATLRPSSLRTLPPAQEVWLRTPGPTSAAPWPTRKPGRLEAYGVNYLKNEWVPVDASVSGDLAFLKSRSRARSTSSRAPTRTTSGSSRSTCNRAFRAYLYERKARSSPSCTSPARARRSSARSHAPVEIKSRDGMTLVSYLTLPPAATPTATEFRKGRADGAAGSRRPVGTRCLWL